MQVVSKRFRQSQIKAAVKVNDEMLRFYWLLGRDMDAKKGEYAWGSKFYTQISRDLQHELPDVKSFSPRNLLYMHQFYRLFPDIGIAQQDVSQFDTDSNLRPRDGVRVSFFHQKWREAFGFALFYNNISPLSGFDFFKNIFCRAIPFVQCHEEQMFAFRNHLWYHICRSSGEKDDEEAR